MYRFMHASIQGTVRVFVRESQHNYIVHVATGVDSKSLQDKLQGWSADEIEALSVVYQTTDLNEDGLIDFLEL